MATQLQVESVRVKYCDGKIECPLMDDECGTECRSQRPENNKKCFTNSTSCKLNVSDHAQSGFTVVQGCPWTFQCENSNQSIDVGKMCDFVEDCELGSDESYCSGKTHFYCESGEPKYIPMEKDEDDVTDCADRSDECKETIFDTLRFNRTATQLFKTLVWMIILTILAGNTAVIVIHADTLRKLKRRNTISFTDHLMLMHLALADLLMGVALVITTLLVFVECENEIDFLVARYNLFCTLCGVLTTVSSQTAVNLLVVLTGYRLYVTRRPFQSQQISFRTGQALAALAWLIGGTFALTPLFVEAFTQNRWHKYSAYLNGGNDAKASVAEYERRTDRIFEYFNKSGSLAHTGGVYTIETAGNGSYEDRRLDVYGSDGFYVSSPICFPDIFTHISPNNVMALAMMTYNAAALVFLAAAYTYIYVFAAAGSRLPKRLSRTATARDERNGRIKRRIFYIVLTDFLCWLPIIVFAFVRAKFTGLDVEVFQTLSVIIFLPLNSALNPVIYTQVHSVVYDKLKRATSTAAAAAVSLGSRATSTTGVKLEETAESRL